MRTLGATLTTAQRQMGDAICKLVLALQSDSTVYTYSLSSTDRLLNLTHTEQEWSQVAQVTVNDSSGTLAALTLEGCSAVLSYGYGSTYSATAPLEVIASKTDSIQGRIVTTISLSGVFNMMGEDEASVAYTPDRINTDTVKTILTAIANATMTCFDHTKNYTITYDSEDALIDVFKPADYFSVSFKESRLSAFKKALAYTKCKVRVEDNSGSPRIHVFVPTISGDTWVASTAYVLNDYAEPTTPTNLFAYRCTTAGTSHSSEPSWPTTAGGTVTEGGGSSLVWTAVAFDYEYNDAYGNYHNFFDKSVRKRLVLPNKVIVMNHPDHDDSYTGNASDGDSYTALNRYVIEHHYVRPVSNAQCTAIAKAAIANYQLGAERGHGVAPMNCGQEVGDYVKITDSKVGDLRIGNIGFINRWYSYYAKQPTRFGFEFRFGNLYMPGLAGTMPPRTITSLVIDDVDGVGSVASLSTSVQDLLQAYWYLDESVRDLVSNQEALVNYIIAQSERAEFANLSVTERLQIPHVKGNFT